ncbi:uncharacterized protein LOC113036945 isoform X3 [Astatotilapia calliptera]|uniref:uncharacterized protein LOC113036945 isoform X3 n=1 Tax=Astatotilapia calliptera TaxID=8154 RepID=UPI000E41F972|nr:uncharacterized protein LOC113036945 isoform X3 [Astatotilapia calliptera]
MKHGSSEITSKELTVGRCRRGEDEGKDTDCLQQFPHCPACKQDYDITLILPCSHTMCGQCVAAGEGARLRRQPMCSVRCPCCRHPVELPCLTWSSAISCLPKHPSMRSNHVNREASPEDHPPHVQEDSSKVTGQTSLYYSSVASSTITPVDGAVDLREEEMEASVFGVISVDGSNGWWLERHSLTFWAVYDGNCEQLCTIPPQIKTIGVFLNIGGGTLSFHNPLTQEHLATLPTRFSNAGVVPALGLGQGRLRLRCGLPPPVYVFLSKSSTYREPHGNSRSEWRQEVPFQSVRKVIQKFEKLALSDSDSGLVSSFGSSCSTLASFPDVGVPGTFQSGKAGQETEP